MFVQDNILGVHQTNAADHLGFAKMYFFLYTQEAVPEAATQLTFHIV